MAESISFALNPLNTGFYLKPVRLAIAAQQALRQPDPSAHRWTCFHLSPKACSESNTKMPRKKWSMTTRWIMSTTLHYDHLVLSSRRTRELLPCGLKWRRLVKLFKKAKSRFYWFDFKVRGHRYRGSTGETKAVRATKVASVKLARALEHSDLFPTKPTVLDEFSQRFQSWLV
jgi:hypothetical protein